MQQNVKNTTYPSLLDLILPTSCLGCGRIGAPLCERCKKYILSSRKAVCPRCKSTQQDSKCHHCSDIPSTYIVGERNELIGTVIHEYKYHSVRSLAKPLSSLLDSILPPLPQNTIIIPLPTIGPHVRARGFDHTFLIAKHLAKSRHIKTQSLLTRANSTVQVGANHDIRIKQAKHAYTLKKDANINPDTTYVLFDDIWTTGASMLTATKLLQQAGAQQIILSLLALSRID